MPGSLATALVLVHALFAVTVVGGLGLLLTAASYDTVDGGVLALTAYGAAPGVLGWWLARRTWLGGVRRSCPHRGHTSPPPRPAVYDTARE
ncbi:hypothetical protein [Streptomyces swartbergensis]|uniref:hypothetical protein n=1 Tax=Streptomyces swartbergensis TaxID=487165 RepID=UPI00380F0903